MALTSNPRGLNDVTAEDRSRSRSSQSELWRITPRSALDTRYRTPRPESGIAEGIIGKKDIRVRCSSRVEWIRGTSANRSRDARSRPRNCSPKNQSRAANGSSAHEGNKQFSLGAICCCCITLIPTVSLDSKSTYEIPSNLGTRFVRDYFWTSCERLFDISWSENRAWLCKWPESRLLYPRRTRDFAAAKTFRIFLRQSHRARWCENGHGNFRTCAAFSFFLSKAFSKSDSEK